MSKQRIRYQQVGKEGKDVAYSEASPRLKEIMGCFGKPLCTYEVDESGKEIKRTPTDVKAAQLFIQGGIIGNLRLFHVMFPEDADQWEARNEVGMTQNQSGSGLLTYKKEKGAKDAALVKVTVTGELKALLNKNPKNPDQVILVRHEVSGEQTYDRTLKIWVSGKLKLTIHFVEFQKGRPAGKTKAEGIVTLKRLTEK